MIGFILDGGSPIQRIKIWHFQFQLSQFVTISSCELHSFSQSEITSREVISDLEKECKSQDEILQLLRERHTNTSQFFDFHESSEMFYRYWVFEPYIYVFLFHGNLIFNLRRAPLYYILGSDDKDILKIDIIYIQSILKRKVDRKCLILINLPKSSSWTVFDKLKGSLFPEGIFPLLAESGLNFPDLIVQHLSISRGGGDNWINALIALTHNQTW